MTMDQNEDPDKNSITELLRSLRWTQKRTSFLGIDASISEAAKENSFNHNPKEYPATRENLQLFGNGKCQSR